MGFRGAGKRGTGGGRKSIEERLSRFGDAQRQKSKETGKSTEPEKPEKKK